MSLVLTYAQRAGGTLAAVAGPVARHVVRPAHLPIWHAAVSAEAQGPRHSGPGVGGGLGVQAGGQAEGHAGPEAQQDVGGREAQGAQDNEEEPALGDSAVMGCGQGSLGLLEAYAPAPWVQTPAQ